MDTWLLEIVTLGKTCCLREEAPNGGLHIFFPFIYPLTKKEIHQVQSDSINKRINLIQRKQAHINYLSKEIQYKKIEEQLVEEKVQKRIKEIQDLFQKEICSDLPNAF